MIKLEPRGERSATMAYLSPVLAALLTMLTGLILFTLLGIDPVEALITILYVPISDTHGITELCVKPPLFYSAPSASRWYSRPRSGI